MLDPGLQPIPSSSASLAGEPGRYEGRQLHLHCALVPRRPLFFSSRILPLSVYTKVEDGAIIRLSRLVTVLVELAFLAFGIVSGTLGIPVGLMWHLADVQVMV